MANYEIICEQGEIEKVKYRSLSYTIQNFEIPRQGKKECNVKIIFGLAMGLVFPELTGKGITQTKHEAVIKICRKM